MIKNILPFFLFSFLSAYSFVGINLNSSSFYTAGGGFGFSVGRQEGNKRLYSNVVAISYDDNYWLSYYAIGFDYFFTDDKLKPYIGMTADYVSIENDENNLKDSTEGFAFRSGLLYSVNDYFDVNFVGEMIFLNNYKTIKNIYLSLEYKFNREDISIIYFPF